MGRPNYCGTTTCVPHNCGSYTNVAKHILWDHTLMGPCMCGTTVVGPPHECVLLILLFPNCVATIISWAIILWSHTIGLSPTIVVPPQFWAHTIWVLHNCGDTQLYRPNYCGSIIVGPIIMCGTSIGLSHLVWCPTLLGLASIRGASIVVAHDIGLSGPTYNRPSY